MRQTGCLSLRGAKGRIVGLMYKQGSEVGLSDSMLKEFFDMLASLDIFQ